MRPPLRILTSHTLERDIGTTWTHLAELAIDGFSLCQSAEVDRLALGVLGLDEVESPVLVDHDDAAGAVHEGEFGAHLADGTGAPDGDGVVFVDAGVDYAVPGCAEYVGEVESLLIGDGVWELEEVDVSKWYTGVLGLSTSLWDILKLF